MNERVPLSFLLAQNKDEDPPVEPTVPFAAMFGDDVKIVTAVLDRTAVLSEPSDRYDRKSVRHDQVLVDPAVITWRTRTAEYDGTRLLTNTKPGAVGAALMGRHRRPSRLNSQPITPGNQPGAEARQASDERALQNQREVEATKQRELAAHRKRHASTAPQITVKHEEEEAMSTVLQETALITRPAAKEKLTKCFSCKAPKPASEFPRPIHRGPNVCTSCTDAKKSPALAASDPTTTQTPATVAVKKTRKPRVQRKVKVGRAAGKPLLGKTIRLGETAELVSTATNGATNNGDARQTKVLALMRRQDALRADLKRVSQEILELVAAG